jgi:hypothetical protein
VRNLSRIRRKEKLGVLNADELAVNPQQAVRTFRRLGTPIERQPGCRQELLNMEVL